MESKSGSNEVKLIKELGREKITVAFSIVPEIADLNSEMDYEEETAEKSESESEEEFNETEVYHVTVDLSKKDKVSQYNFSTNPF